MSFHVSAQSVRAVAGGLVAAATLLSGLALAPTAMAAAPPTMKRILSGTEISLMSSSKPPSISTFLPSLLAFNAILII